MNKLGLESPAITLLTNATLRAASKTRTTLGFTLFKTDPIIFYSQQLNSSDKSLFSIRIRRNKVYQSHYFNTSVTLNADRKSTRLNSSHVASSYAVFCLKKKRKKTHE